MEITGSNGSAVYLDLLDELIRNGTPSSPRGQATREILDVQVILTDPASVHTLETARCRSQRITATETAHLIAGASSLEQLDAVSGGRFTQFADNGRLRGAYGPRAYSQLERVIRLLSDDPVSRQAAVSIWNGTELAAPSKDVPCTTMLQFTIRNGQLNMRTSMRSNDIFLGYPIDTEMFAALQKTVANVVGVLPGRYTHVISSLHLYERDVPRATEILEAGLSGSEGSAILPDGALPQVTSLNPVQRWHFVRQAMEDVIMAPDDGDNVNWKLWQHTLASFIRRLPSPGTWRVCSCRYITNGTCQDCDSPSKAPSC